MTELITKMLLCLTIALLIGLAIGWVLSKIVQSKKHRLQTNTLDKTLNDKNNHIEMLEKKVSDREREFLEATNENKELKESLIQKSNDLVTMEDKLKNLDGSTAKNLKLQEENQELQLKLTQLSDDLHAKSKELEEFETVLIKAEETIEKKLETDVELASSYESEEKLKSKVEELILTNDDKEKTISQYQKKISELENELNLYTTDKEDDEFIVSKDQFTHIEEQLVEYQKEIEKLKEDNSRLLKLSTMEKSTDNSTSENDTDDDSLTKLFRGTYKKVTKS